MSENTQANCPVNLNELREAVCIHTSKVTDSFRDKDCIEDLRVYLTRDSQCALDRATGARARYAELLHVGLEVEPVPFHRGHYSVDITYYYRILADALMGNARPVPIFGLAVFSKRVVLYGGEPGRQGFHQQYRARLYRLCRPDRPCLAGGRAGGGGSHDPGRQGHGRLQLLPLRPVSLRRAGGHLQLL